jgi:hypothetical protein
MKYAQAVILLFVMVVVVVTILALLPGFPAATTALPPIEAGKVYQFWTTAGTGPFRVTVNAVGAHGWITGTHDGRTCYVHASQVCIASAED